MRAFIGNGLLLTCLCLTGGFKAVVAAPDSPRASSELTSGGHGRLGIRASIRSAVTRSEPTQSRPYLGTLGAIRSTQATAISERGHVAGLVGVGVTYPVGGFLWERGVLTDLDPKGDWIWGNYWLGVDVNIHGQVVASAGRRAGVDVRPLLFDRGQIIDLMDSRPGVGAAVAINNRGQVVGVVGDEASPSLLAAFLWDRGRWIDLGPTSSDPEGAVPTYAYGLALNDHGDVVATNPLIGGERSSFLWRRGVKTQLDFVVTGINQRGQIIGNSAAYADGFASGVRAYLWEDGTRTDLGTLGGDRSFASAINDKGQIAGVSLTAAGEYHAFLWEDGRMTDLGGGDPGSYLIVEGINSRGQVVGSDPSQPERWLWDHGAVVPIAPAYPSQPIPGPAVMIDDHGRVAFNTVNISFSSFLWSNGEIIPLAPSETPAGELVSMVDGDRASASITSAERTTGDGRLGAVSFAVASANPFSGSATLRYAIPNPEHVVVDVFDVRGTRVRALVDEWQSAGTRLISWDGADATGRAIPRGLYFSRLRVGTETRMVKLIRGR